MALTVVYRNCIYNKNSLGGTKNEENQWQSEWRFIGNGDEKLKAPKITKIILGTDVSIENETKLREYCKQNNIPITKVI